MAVFGKFDKLIKMSGKVDKPNTTGLVEIFRSLFKEELSHTKNLRVFFIILAIAKIDNIIGENVKGYKGRERV